MPGHPHVRAVGGDPDAPPDRSEQEEPGMADQATGQGNRATGEVKEAAGDIKDTLRGRTDQARPPRQV